LTYPYNGWIATSPLEVIALNKLQNLHTLVLLDLDPTGEGVGKQKPMQPLDAKNAFVLMEKKLSESLESMPQESSLDLLKHEACKQICSNIESLEVVLCSDMGTEMQKITFTNINGLESCKNGRLHCIIVPSNLSDVEEKALSRWTKD
jgi:diphthamide biosynthesis methyltransferase